MASEAAPIMVTMTPTMKPRHSGICLTAILAVTLLSLSLSFSLIMTCSPLSSVLFLKMEEDEKHHISTERKITRLAPVFVSPQSFCTANSGVSHHLVASPSLS